LKSSWNEARKKRDVSRILKSSSRNTSPNRHSAAKSWKLLRRNWKLFKLSWPKVFTRPRPSFELNAISATLARVSTTEPDTSEDEIESTSEYNWKHQCVSEFQVPGFYTSTSCDDQHPSSPADLFKCSQAECQVCLNLSWKYFPLYSKCSPQFHEYSKLRKRITTTLAKLKASENCNYCNIVFGAIKQGCKRKVGGNSPSFEELLPGRVCKVEIVLRRKFTIELVIAKGLPSELHLEVYTVSSKHPEFSFIPQFAKSAEKMHLPYQIL
jgi:hypothetical protein